MVPLLFILLLPINSLMTLITMLFLPTQVTYRLICHASQYGALHGWSTQMVITFKFMPLLLIRYDFFYLLELKWWIVFPFEVKFLWFLCRYIFVESHWYTSIMSQSQKSQQCLNRLNMYKWIKIRVLPPMQKLKWVSL